MKIQIRQYQGGIKNVEATALDIMEWLLDGETMKVSFDLEESRIALYPDGTYQIFGGAVNYPTIGIGE